ncbi:DUF2235 domain-containing protein [Pseudomonas sp. Ps21-P2]|uniref:T6SS phospholipase effector Tle1-like catalytic domain-containing protein n=1 Tax=Pseudomonas sp. Ps21-P2 TaxID=3080331 RepID=UPI00320895F7
MTKKTISHASADSRAGAQQVTVRLGVFFDGTGNNRVNSQIGADCQAMAEVYGGVHIKECGGRHTDAGSSYSNSPTNIARLAGLYKQQRKAIVNADGLFVYGAVYVSGVGTTSGGRDSRLSGQGFGRGTTGVVAKVSRGIKKLADELHTFESDNPGCVIGALELDVFGFSRGAASARHLANEVLKKSRGALDPVLDPRKLPLSDSFSWASGSVRLKVIGLFDTVAAVGGISDLGSVRDAVNKRVNLFLPPGCAQQVLHLVAGDEHRRNFVLNSVKPDWPQEIVLPGSHSDIGGGYQPQEMEKVSLFRPRRSLVSVSTPYDTTDAWLQAHAELSTLDAGRLLDPTDDSASLGVECFERFASSSRGVKTVVATVKLERRVYNHLALVYLRLMHALACDEGVPFLPIKESAETSLPPELRPIAAKLISHAKGEGGALSDAEQTLLYRRYIHRSAHWNNARRDSLVDGLFVHAPALNGRQMFTNLGQLAYPQ